MSDYLKPLINLYSSNADAGRSVSMAKYMKSQFEFFGINSPTRKDLDRSFLKLNGKPDINDIPVIVKRAYLKPQREVQYFINDLTSRMAKNLPESFIDTAEFMIRTKSWWDTVDAIAVNIVGPLAMNYPAVNSLMDGWILDSNMWIQRSAILYQLKYKSKTDYERLLRYCDLCKTSNEFFIRKAIGWSLREYSKTSQDKVLTYVNNTDLSGLSKREALKWLERKGRI